MHYIKVLYQNDTIHYTYGVVPTLQYWDIYIVMGHQSPYTMAHNQIGGPVVTIYKHAYYGSSPPLDPKSIMPANMHVCERQKWRACSQGNIV